MEIRKRIESVLLGRLPTDLIKIVLSFVPFCYRRLKNWKAELEETLPFFLAMSPEGDRLLANQASGLLCMYRLEATGLRRDKKCFASEAWLQLNLPRIVDVVWKEDHIFMVDRGYDRILVFNEDGGFVRQWCVKDPFAIAVCRDMVFVATTQNGYATRVFSRSDGSLMGTWPNHGVMQWKMEVDDLRDEIWVTDCKNERVVLFSLDGKMKKTWGRSGQNVGQFLRIRGILFHKNEVYVCDCNRVQVFTRQGQFLRQWFVGSLQGGLITSCFDESFIVTNDSTPHRYCMEL